MWVTPIPRDTSKTKGCQLCNDYDNSVIIWLIALKLCMHVGISCNIFSCVKVEMLLHLRTCKSCSQISGTAELITLKFRTLMGTG